MDRTSRAVLLALLGGALAALGLFLLYLSFIVLADTADVAGAHDIWPLISVAMVIGGAALTLPAWRGLIGAFRRR